MDGIDVSDIPRLVVLHQDHLKVLNLESNHIIDNLDKVHDFKAYSDYLFAIGTTQEGRPELLVYDWDQHYLADSVTLLPGDVTVKENMTAKLRDNLDGVMVVKMSSSDQHHIVAVQQESKGKFNQAVAVKTFKKEKFAINLGKNTVLLFDKSSADLWKPFEGNSQSISKSNALQQFLKSEKLSSAAVLSADLGVLAVGSKSGTIMVCGNPVKEDAMKPACLRGHKQKVSCHLIQ